MLQIYWQRANVYFTCIKPLLQLINILNMNKINPFISEISQETCKIDEITVLKMNKINLFFSEISQETQNV